jgi:hypothetical protein
MKDIMSEDQSTVFFERQYFTQWWVWLLLLGLLALPLYGLYVQLVQDRPWGNNPMSDIGLAVFAISMAGFAYFFKWMRMDTVCDKDGMRVKFRPFVNKRVHWKEIADARVVDYGFVGYGIRYGSKYGTVYNVKGRLGLAVTTTNGLKFVIGTQRGQELEAVVAKFLK